MHLTVKRLDSYPILILRGKKKATKWVCSHLSRGADLDRTLASERHLKNHLQGRWNIDSKPRI